MGAHIALYTSTELNYSFYGIIVHNPAVMPKKKSRYTKDELKLLYSYLPGQNVEY